MASTARPPRRGGTSTLGGTTTPGTGSLYSPAGRSLLHRAHAAGLLEFLLRRLAVLLRRTLLERLGDALNELLRLLQAQASDTTDNLQHRNLLVSRERLQDQVKLSLLRRRRTRVAALRLRGSPPRDRSHASWSDCT